MSTIAASQESYVRSGKKISFMEKFKKYIAENNQMITAGILIMNGKTPYLAYRMTREED